MSTNKQRFFGRILAFLVLATLLVGSTSAMAEPAKDEEITLNFWRAGTDANTEAYWLGFIERFSAVYPNIHVNLSSLPWGDEIETKLNAAFASGTGPDVLQYAIVSIPQRASMGQYLPLTDYIANWSGKDDIFPSVLDMGTYDGQVYGLGMRPDARMFVWRKDMFEAAGLDPETPPKNWDELYEYAKKLTIYENGTTKQGGFSLSVVNGFQDFQIFLTQNGGDFINTDTLEPLYNSAAGVETLEFMNKMVQEGIVIPQNQHQASGDAFETGLSAMAYKSTGSISGMIANNPDLEGKIGTSGPLTKVQQSTFCGMGLQFISADSKHKDAAWKFVEMSMTSEEFTIREEQLGLAPVLESMREAYVAKNPMNATILESIATGHGAYAVTFSNRLNEVVSAAIEEAYFGKKTPEQALNDSAAAFTLEIPTLIN